LVGRYEAVDRATWERELRWLARELRAAWRERLRKEGYVEYEADAWQRLVS
jgi:hypothetical protein